MSTNQFSQNLQPERSMRATLLIGVGLMAAIDEIIFHQLLAWHHFYDRATPEIALMADGLLHSAELIAIVAGFYMFSDVRRQQALVPLKAWAGLFVGLGGFQLFDGVIDHKVLRTHQIRYNVELLPYDIAWNLPKYKGNLLFNCSVFIRYNQMAFRVSDILPPLSGHSHISH